MAFDKGDRVKVASKEIGFVGSYYEAKVVSVLAQMDSYIVRYKNLVKNDFSEPLLEVVTEEELRSVPYEIPTKGFRLGDIVDAFANDGWWVGTIYGKFGGKYVVYFDVSSKNKFVYPASRLRIHQEFKREEELVMDIGNLKDENSKERTSLVLIGRLLTYRNFNIEAFKRTMTQAWTVTRRIVIKLASPNLLLF